MTNIVQSIDSACNLVVNFYNSLIFNNLVIGYLLLILYAALVAIPVIDAITGTEPIDDYDND